MTLQRTICDIETAKVVRGLSWVLVVGSHRIKDAVRDLYIIDTID